MKKRLLAIILSMTLFVLSVVGVGAVDATNEADTFSMVSMNFATGVETESTFELTDSELELIEEVVLSRKAPFDVTATPTLQTGFESGNSSRAIIGDSDGRTPVANESQYPYSAIAYIEMVWPSLNPEEGPIASGTAFMISDSLALTSAHCIYNKNLGGWPVSIAAFPGKKGIGFWNDPYGSTYCYIGEGYVCSDYISALEEGIAPYVKDDWAIIRLINPLGEDTGKFILDTLDNSQIIGASIKLCGYPGDLGICEQFEMVGSIHAYDSGVLYYNMDSNDGQSGSPVFNINPNSNGEYVVYGIHQGNSVSMGYNRCVRITQNIINIVNNKIAEYE